MPESEESTGQKEINENPENLIITSRRGVPMGRAAALWVPSYCATLKLYHNLATFSEYQILYHDL